MAEEVRNPVKSFPPSLLTGIVAASIIYLLVGFTAAMTVPLDVVTKSSGPLLEVVERGLLPINRTGEIYQIAIWLLVGGLALWALNFLVARRTGTVVAEEDLTGDSDG